MAIDFISRPPANDCCAGFASILSPAAMAAAHNEISQWQGYAATPLHTLPRLAKQCGVSAVWYKDEASRFGLGSFKSLGGAYAVLALHAQQSKTAAAEYTVATATDGNHGRSVAWGAQLAGCRAVIFVHQEVSTARVEAMSAYGAEVIRINGNYDDSVKACAQQAAQHGWQIVSDTSWAGYTEVPKLVMAGYTVLMQEIQKQLQALAANDKPTHILLPAGVGTFAASMIIAAAAVWKPLPRMMIIESNKAACLLKSAQQNKISTVDIREETLMAGLSCGEPSLLAWEVLSAAASDFVAIDDTQVPQTMCDLARGVYGDDGDSSSIEAGECSTAGIIALQQLQAAEETRNTIFNADSKVLVFGTEGATDVDSYQKILNEES